MASRRRTVCLCVDDFGLDGGINEAVLTLVQKKRIGATGCMVDGPAWAEGAVQLRALPPAQLDVGLHVDLTETRLQGARSGQKTPLRALIIASYRGQLDAAWLAGEVARQFDLFEQHMQRPPDFVDGHQHVHQLPQVRDALFAELLRRCPEQATRPWLRCTRPALRGTGVLGAGAVNALKAQVIAWLGASAFAAQAAQHGFAMNRALAGVYGFDVDAHRYQQLLAVWLQRSRHGDVLMCHPSTSVVPGDAIASARCMEYQVLASDHFDDLLQQADVHIGPLSACGTAPSAP